MKRYLLPLFIAMHCLLAGCSSDLPPKEQFKEFHEIVYRIDNGVQVKKSEWKYVHEYDQQGEVNKTLYYDAEGLTSYTVRQLDSQSGIVTHTSFDASDKKQSWSESLLKNEKVIWDKHYDSQGTLIQIIKSKSDDQGRQTEALYLKGDETILHKLVYEYDDEANTKIRTTYDAEGKRTQPYKIVDRYDENNNLIKQDWYDSPDRIHLTFEYTYLDGKRQTETQSSLGKVFKKKTYKHDKRGNIQETHTYEPDGDSEELTLREIRMINYKY